MLLQRREVYPAEERLEELADELVAEAPPLLQSHEGRRLLLPEQLLYGRLKNVVKERQDAHLVPQRAHGGEGGGQQVLGPAEGVGDAGD